MYCTLNLNRYDSNLANKVVSLYNYHSYPTHHNYNLLDAEKRNKKIVFILLLLESGMKYLL